MTPTDTAAILERIDARLAVSGMSDRQASLEATGATHTIRNMRKGSKPSVEAIEQLARVLDVTPAYLAFGDGTDQERRAPMSSPASMPPIARVPIIGQVAAGLWLEVDTAVDAPLYEGVPIPPDPDFKLDEQFAVEVRGTSINKVAPDGAILGCIDTRKTRRSARDGDLVIVEQRRNGGQEIMRTAKRYFDHGDYFELHPDSNDPRWTPMRIEKNAEPDDGVSVEVIGIVTWFHAPLNRMDRSRRA